MSDPTSSPALSHLQAWMQQALVWSGTGTKPEDIETFILPSSSLSPAERLSIYQRGYYARLLQCMEGQYKALSHALGNALFRDFAREYLQQFPSASPTLSELGARFPQWLSENRPDKDAEQPEEWIDFMIELAKYEWALYLFFDKPGHEGSPLATANTADGDMVIQRSLELHDFTFPVAAYYHGVAQGGDPDIPGRETSLYAIVRVNYKIMIFRLSEEQYAFLEAMKKSGAMQKNPAWDDWKQKWITAGFFELA